MAVDEIVVDSDHEQTNITPRTSRTRKVFKWLRVYLVPALGVICTGAGLGIGCFVRLSLNHVLTSDTVIMMFSIPGEVLMRMLKVIILPLVVSSTFSASSRLPTTLLGKMSVRILLFYLTTSLLSAVVGVISVFVFQPKTWDFLHAQTSDYVENENYWLSILLDFIRNMLPENLIRAFYQHTQTSVVTSEFVSYHYEGIATDSPSTETTTISTLIDDFTEPFDLFNVTDFVFDNASNSTTDANALNELNAFNADESVTETVFDAFADYLTSNLNWTDYDFNHTFENVTDYDGTADDNVTASFTSTVAPPTRKVVKKITQKTEWIGVYKAGPSLIGLVVTHAAFGIASRHVKNKLVVLVEGFCTALHLVMIKMSRAIMWYFPIGVFFLTLTDVMATGKVYPFSQEMALFAAAMASAMVLHGVVTLSLLYWFLIRRNPFLFWKYNWSPFLVAFAAKSRVVSLPFSMKSMENNEGIDNRVTRLFLPLGSALNSDGDAIYGTVATLFLVQMSGVELSLEHYFYVCLLSFVLSFTSNTLHTNGIVYMHQLLIVQMSTQQLAVLTSVDWIGGRLREMVNVISDAVAVSVMQHYGADELKNSDRGKNYLDKLNNRFIPKTYSYDSSDSMDDSDTNGCSEKYTDV